jgi:hypothetical protein
MTLPQRQDIEIDISTTWFKVELLSFKRFDGKYNKVSSAANATASGTSQARVSTNEAPL